ncbi:hypothetical protein F4802DRAFT_336266 [Xylaria palmicola]|nr:hypothetical protein F4802DRAFT_336266 [Xylaria palmicola]
MESGRSSGDGLKIIHASLFRMGTKSMAQAYAILGYNVNHALLFDVLATKWNELEQAAEATWPAVPGATPRPPYTTADWDELWGSEYDVVTDVASPFAPELIRAYPDARVVVVQRDFDAWWPSFARNIRDRILAQPGAALSHLFTSVFLGVRPTPAMTKVLLGLFGVGSRREMGRARGRLVYEDYFRRVRELVPPERRLEYRIGDGWEPLCDFLGVDVPQGVPFPRGNDGAALDKQYNSRFNDYIYYGMKTFSAGAVGRTLAGCFCGWLAYRWLLS